MTASSLQPHDCLFPDWPAPAGVRAVLTTRAGGVSEAPYGGPGSSHGLNLGLHTGDAASDVAENRARLTNLLAGRPIAWLDQCHGTDVVSAEHAIALGTPPQADAVVSVRDDDACAIMVADCLPVLMCDQAGQAVGAAHAGWRGLCSGVLERTAETLMALAGSRPLMAYLGPAIGPQAFEVGAEVREAFLDAALPEERDRTAAAFVPKSRHHVAEAGAGKYFGDLPALARLRLRRLGVLDVHGGDLCTFSDAQRFYSYRRDGRTGRQAALIWRDSR